MTGQGHSHPLDRLNVLEYMATDGILGGLENHVLTLCEHLDRSQFRIALAWPTDTSQDILRRASAIGVPVHGPTARGRDTLSYLKRTSDLARLFRSKGIHVLHIHACGFTGLNALIAAQLARVPAIVVTHHLWFGPHPHNWTAHLTLRLEKRLAARAIALYTAQAQEMAATGMPARRVCVVPNCVDLRKFPYTETLRAGEPSTPWLVMVARMVHGKGHEQLVEAVARLVGRYPNLRALMIGDGPMRPSIEARIHEAGLGGNIQVAGQIQNERLPDLLRGARATVLPTYYAGETFPISLLEGMAMGLAAIGTRWAGIPDMILDGETGFIVEPRDIASLAAAIETVLKDPCLAAEMGRRGRARVQRHFSAEALGCSVSAIYLEAVSSNTKKAGHL